MSPLELEILLHYSYSNDDFREGDFSAPAVQEAINAFSADVGLDLLKENTHYSTSSAKHMLTSKGEAYVEKLCSLPLPRQAWIFPDED